ncbi:hypothetical protein [Jiangella mangrovi]|uniref:Uncharacterized protein n=1 Tax=Jiangella mangrovi TaxID=1524084 RepID=A0A7W9GLX5_9ACTN|nr:hypothetical protein [Jiangella mangrovi]MBB5786106.1 hypothetical protein [Jiangella mangrovi]
MRFADDDGVDSGLVPDPEDSLSRTRMHLENGVMAWRSTKRASVPSTRPGDLDPWIRAIKEFFAALPYRLVDEFVGPDPDRPSDTTAILRFERTDIDRLRVGLRGRGDGERRGPAGPARTSPAATEPAFEAGDGPDLEFVALRESLIFHRSQLERRLPGYAPRFSAPRPKRHLLDEWERAVVRLFADHGYRLTGKDVTDHPTQPGWLSCELRFFRMDPDGGD